MELTDSRSAMEKTKMSVPSWLQDGLKEMTAEERTCLLLREQANLSVGEIAEITGLGPERTRLALFSARERLRLSLRRT